jgi:hypothetical protein
MSEGRAVGTGDGEGKGGDPNHHGGRCHAVESGAWSGIEAEPGLACPTGRLTSSLLVRGVWSRAGLGRCDFDSMRRREPRMWPGIIGRIRMGLGTWDRDLCAQKSPHLVCRFTVLSLQGKRRHDFLQHPASQHGVSSTAASPNGPQYHERRARP